MEHFNQQKILIATAGFGDGHNSAAHNLAKAFESIAEAEVIDPCAIGAPFTNNQIRKFYRFITTHTPQIWHRIYKSVEKRDFSKQNFRTMRKPERALKEFMLSFQPDAFVSTYPLYPYHAERAFQSGVPRIPVFTVITDSIEINAAWKKAPTDYFLVTDHFTKLSLAKQGIDEHKIIETGFPVHPRFTQLATISADDSIDPFKILYFPTAKKPTIRRIMRAILEADKEQIQVTVVLGRNTRKLYRQAREIQLEFPGKVEIKGWTRQVPELLSSHHLTVGKAGGATVHETIAASCPMLIHHLVPGQEEGNLELLEKIGGGYYESSPVEISRRIRELLENDAQQWRQMKRNLLRHKKPAGAITAAQFILNTIKNKTT